MNNKKGFTLIELLAVILILGIIALIAVPVTSKTINTAQKSSFKTGVINSFKTLDYTLYKKDMNIIPKEGIDVSDLNLKSDFTGGKFMLVDGKEIAFYIKDKKYCAYGPMDELLISDNCSSLDLTKPEVDESKISIISNTSGIKVTLNDGVANDPDSGIEKYVINLYEGDKLIQTQEKKQLGEILFTDLKPGVIYTVEIIIYNGAGGKTIYHQTIKSGAINLPTFSVSSNDEWTKNKTVTVNYDAEKYNCEYSLDIASTWNTYTEPFTISENGTIMARLIDKEALTNKSGAANKVITKIDNNLPVINLTKSGKIITLVLKDEDSGISSYCIKTTSGSSGCSWTSVTSDKTVTKTYTASTITTYYGYAKDIAGNISEVSSINLSISGTPTISVSNETSWTSSKTVTLTYDTTKYNCEYSTDGASTWKSYSSSFSISSNVTINARLVDKVDNSIKGSSTNKTITKIDNTNPSVSLSKNSKVITISLSDSQSGISYYCTKTTSGSSGCSWTSITNTTSTTKTYTVPAANTYYVYAKDAAGNISSEKFITISSAEYSCSYNTGQTWTFNYNGSYQTFSTPCAGTYKLEVYGAQGAAAYDYRGRDGAYGGYSYGNISITKSDTLYIYVGGQNGYNGGGSGGTGRLGNSGGNGGGATDIRKNSTSTSYRIIVAGGGGGAGGDSQGNGSSVVYQSGGLPGYGGGSSGESGAQGESVSWDSGYGGAGGSQYSGGYGGTSPYNDNTGADRNYYPAGGGGGGGGYYGGGGGGGGSIEGAGFSYSGNTGGAGSYGQGGYGGDAAPYGYSFYSGSGGGGGGGSGYTGGVSGGSTSSNYNSGNGYAKITLTSIG